MIEMGLEGGNGEMSIKERKMNDCLGCMDGYGGGEWFYCLEDFRGVVENCVL